MKHMYCEKCRHLFEGERCPNCRKSRVRPVKLEDPCFLTEKRRAVERDAGGCASPE